MKIKLRQSFITVFVLSLLVLPIAKADGCGIICPAQESGLLSFFIRLLCNFGTWTMCHAISLVLFIIFIAVVWFYLYTRDEETRKRFFIIGKILLVILLLIIFFPLIKAFLFTSPFVPTTTICGSCPNTEAECVLNEGNNGKTALANNEWLRFQCPEPTSVVLTLNRSGILYAQSTNDYCPTTADTCTLPNQCEIGIPVPGGTYYLFVANNTVGNPYNIYMECARA